MSARGERRAGVRVQEDAQPARRALRILIVENDADTRTFFRLYLQQLGHQADAAGGVNEAIAMLKEGCYDVLLADIGLADGSGWDLMDIVRQGNIPCPPYPIAMTGYGLAEDRARSTAAGYRHHLLKPLEPAKLKALLEEAAREAAGTP